MLHLPGIFAISMAVIARYTRAQYSATYLPSNVPAKTEQGQAGTNQCGTASNPNSECQNAFINSVTDFCVFAPPNPGPDSVIGNTERIEVAWCLQDGTGARLMPDGTITGAHFIETPDFVQVTGIGDLTKLNIPAGDGGGELDPHGADGNGNPIGGLVFSTAFGPVEQIHEWTNFVSDQEFCFRACKPGPKAATFCQHIYDVMGCFWNMPGNYGPGFENCQADSGEPMGVYGTSTFFQGQPATPLAHPAPASSNCVAFSTVGNGLFNSGTTVNVPAPSQPIPVSITTLSGSRSSSSSSATSLTAPLPSSSSGTVQGSTGVTQPPGISTTGAPTAPAATNTSSSATRSAIVSGWERAVVTFGSAVICWMLGAAIVL